MAAVLSGCVGGPPPETYREPEIVPVTVTQSELNGLPSPASRVPVAVYGFEDETGQFKPQENVQTLSRAVSQGGAALLIKALRDAGDGSWFTVLEREGLDNLLKERQIIRDQRLRYLGEQQINPQALPPLLFAGIILEGGIVGFDTNTLTGGVGARFMGIGGDVEYRQNTISVNLRAVSVKTGEVLVNVTVDKTLASVGIQGGAFKFIDFDELLEVEAGITNNEPGTMALRRAIEKSVYAMIMEGSEAGLWSFGDLASAQRLISEYREAELTRFSKGTYGANALAEERTQSAAIPNEPIRAREEAPRENR
ncbi:MAG: CsgG/HfaB family protein [Pseudomonadota bacterium]